MSRLLCRTMLAGVAAVLAGAAQAQVLPPSAPLAPPPPEANITGVTVAAPKIIERTKYGLIVQDMSLSVRVPYSDLDMSTAAGMAELDRRVGEGAEYACQQLEAMYPQGRPELRQCERRAVSDAQPQVVAARAGG